MLGRVAPSLREGAIASLSRVLHERHSADDRRDASSWVRGQDDSGVQRQCASPGDLLWQVTFMVDAGAAARVPASSRETGRPFGQLLQRDGHGSAIPVMWRAGLHLSEPPGLTLACITRSCWESFCLEKSCYLLSVCHSNWKTRPPAGGESFRTPFLQLGLRCLRLVYCIPRDGPHPTGGKGDSEAFLPFLLHSTAKTHHD